MINTKWQSTLKEKVRFTGKGLHSGRIVTLDIHPAEADTGITFTRTDCDAPVEIKAHALNISSTMLNTTIGSGHTSVSTIEHLMAALAGLGIGNARIIIDGPEVPILDGSSRPFIEKLMRFGVKLLAHRQSAFFVTKPFEYRIGDQYVKVRPARQQKISCIIDFPHPAIGRQSMTYSGSKSEFLNVGSARTFCSYSDVRKMRAQGLALGGSLDNAIVLDDKGVMNDEGLRSSQEFVQHKLLDLVGDLYLLGSPLIGSIEAYKPGHRLHAEFMKALLEQPSVIEQRYIGEQTQSQHIDIIPASAGGVRFG